VKSSAIDIVEKKILRIRDQEVILDQDLAELYGVETKVLKQAVKRNKNRFPDDFMFVLNREEFNNLRSQIVTSSWGGTRYLPMAFTEHGAIMAATVLNTPRAIEMSVFVVRAFVKLREIVSGHRELAKKLDQLERKVQEHDEAIRGIVSAIRRMTLPSRSEKRIGFKVDEGKRKMKFYLGVTDTSWYTYLSRLYNPEDINFWQPGGGAAFKVLGPGAVVGVKVMLQL